jgi:hypothetical protein
VSFARGIDGSSSSSTRSGGRIAMHHEEVRRSIRTDALGVGTLACAQCDAPVALGAEGVAPGDELTCPFCDHRGPAREFLSLSLPTRPARVVVRLRRR